MALNWERLEAALCERLCADVRIHKRDDGMHMLIAPFSFPDGDGYPIYLSESRSGGVILSDLGNTLMHASYEHDIDAFYSGTRAALREQIVQEHGIKEHEGAFEIETSPDRIAKALFTLGQALTKIHDLTFLSRDRAANTFYEDLKGMLLSMVGEESITAEYISPDVPNGNDYPVDFCLQGRLGVPVFVFGVPNRDKTRLTTITLAHLLRNKLLFESIIVFADQQEIPRPDLARLTDVSGPAVSSLEAEGDLQRKVNRYLPTA